MFDGSATKRWPSIALYRDGEQWLLWHSVVDAKAITGNNNEMISMPQNLRAALGDDRYTHAALFWFYAL